jgi:hypothetical protein
VTFAVGEKGIPQGLKPASFLALNAKAKALAYLEAGGLDPLEVVT